MPSLARKLSLWNYFALGFGTMVGAGWVVLMDDWLGRGGPLGAMLGFALGGILLLPVSYIYGQWVRRLPDAAGEAAYTAQVFPSLSATSLVGSCSSRISSCAPGKLSLPAN